jgi:hypothetical protein
MSALSLKSLAPEHASLGLQAVIVGLAALQYAFPVPDAGNDHRNTEKLKAAIVDTTQNALVLIPALTALTSRGADAYKYLVFGLILWGSGYLIKMWSDTFDSATPKTKKDALALENVGDSLLKLSTGYYVGAFVCFIKTRRL